MRVSVQVVIESPDGSPVTTEIACLDRGELEAGSLGLHLSEAKSILEGLQRSMVDAQVAAFIVRASACPSCGMALQRKGSTLLSNAPYSANSNSTVPGFTAADAPLASTAASARWPSDCLSGPAPICNISRPSSRP